MVLILNDPLTYNFRHLSVDVYGGPYRKYTPHTRRLIGVKMAKEIDHPHDFSIPTADFSIPDADVMIDQMSHALYTALLGNDIYVGCMGGIGRTGLFLLCLSKVEYAYAHHKKSDDVTNHEIRDMLDFIRAEYHRGAVETGDQLHFAYDLNVDCILGMLERHPSLQSAKPCPEPSPLGMWGSLGQRIHRWLVK